MPSENTLFPPPTERRRAAMCPASEKMPPDRITASLPVARRSAVHAGWRRSALRSGHGARFFQSYARRLGRSLPLAGLLLTGALRAANTNLAWQADLTLKEAYDDNVYLQDVAPGPGVPDAVSAKKGSLVTTVAPHLALEYKALAVLNLSLNYAPNIVVYHNAPSEDYTAHHAGMRLAGQTGKLVWEQANHFTYIDGSRFGPIFAHPQDVPAIGGVPLRNRRNAFIYLGDFSLAYRWQHFFIRPVASAYVHDFKTVQMLHPPGNPPGGIYENYIDRQDVNGGLDIGYDVGRQTFLVLGYRYGRQDQFKFLGVDSPYDSAYHRILLGVEGRPAPWLRLAVLGGPDIRDWARGTPAGFDRSQILCWMDATITILPTKKDSLTLFNHRYEQPAFASVSVYEDITYRATWTHRFNDHFSATAGFQLYAGEWHDPVSRNDWIYTPSVRFTYTYNPHFSAELGWSTDLVDSKVAAVPGTATEWADGREFSRNVVSLAVRLAF